MGVLLSGRIPCFSAKIKQLLKQDTLYIIRTERKGALMSITVTELRNNLGKYLFLSAMEDVFITKNGKVVAKLTTPYQDRVQTARSLFGILPKDADIERPKRERSDAGQIIMP